MNTNIKVGDVLASAPDVKVPMQPMRVLDLSLAEDKLWAIELPRPHRTNPGRFRSYRRGPKEFKLSELSTEVRHSKLCVAPFVGRAELDVPKGDILASATTAREKAFWSKTFEDRDTRWEIIKPLVQDGSGANKPFLTVFLNPDLPSQIRKRSLKLSVAASTVYSLLHQFWALGSNKNALCTGYWRCGCPGRTKEQCRNPKNARSKRGRPSRLNATQRAPAGYVVTPADYEKIRWCYLRIRTMSPRRAYMLFCQLHYADRTVNSKGEVSHMLWPPHRRPTKTQFLYWGKKLTAGKSVSRLVLGERVWNEKTNARGGSLQQEVAAVGQLGVYDSTSADFYLNSSWSRLDNLPPAKRLLIRDTRSELIAGMDLGWEPVSQVTALRCLLHAATPKAQFCRRFGVEIEEDEWPAIFFRNVRADNGEMKGDLVSEAEDQFGFSMDYPRPRSGASKGGIESQHHADHKNLDHEAPGTTKGKRRKPGEPDPACSAGWNYYEAMYEQIKAILDHNNQERPEIAPAAMLRDFPDIRPTRLNIFKWLRDQGHTAEVACDIGRMRAFMLPAFTAVIHKDGVYLKDKVLGYERILLKMRYCSTELVKSGLMSKVKASEKAIDCKIRMDENNPAHAWLMTTRGSLPLQLQSNDTVFTQQTTLLEWRKYLEHDTLVRDAARGDDEQRDSEKYERRDQVTERSRGQRRAELAASNGRSTKKRARKNLRANAKKQTELLKGGVRKPRKTVSSNPRVQDFGQADVVMDSFHQRKAQHA